MIPAAVGGGATRKLRILLIAYEFPPSPSAQSLRWAYLAGRLATFGHEVHVMAPKLGGVVQGLPQTGPGVEVHRIWPGPIRSVLLWLERRRPAPLAGMDRDEKFDPGDDNRPDPVPRPATDRTLNWKGRLVQRALGVVSLLVFPDVRGEWRLPARFMLPRLLRRIQPDVVVSSHEPATTLQLGLQAKRLGFRWVADIADPVLAPYTPGRWRRRASSLEAQVMREADHVLVTAQSALHLLAERHPVMPPVSVVSQGFDEQFVEVQRAPSRKQTLELLYAGSFYSFRDPRALVDAVLDVPAVRLSIASRHVPDWLKACSREFPEKVLLLGSVPHLDLLQRQREADVLVNLANANPCQVPGKLYEYFGARRPILHVMAEAGDASGEMLSKLARGWACPGGSAEIARILRNLVDADRQGRLLDGLDLALEPVQGWAWTTAARQVERVLLQTGDTGL